MDPTSGYWVVAFTQICVNLASFILHDTYASLRLWALSRQEVEFIRERNITLLSGSAANVSEFLEFITLIERTYSISIRRRSETETKLGLTALVVTPLGMTMCIPALMQAA